MKTRKTISLLRRSVILVRGTMNRPGREFKNREVVKRAEGKVNVNNGEKYKFSL